MIQSKKNKTKDFPASAGRGDTLLHMIRLLKLSLCLFFILSILPGCFDDEDIDQRMIVSPIGIDNAPDGKMLVTFRFPLVFPGGDTHSGSTPNSKNYILRYTTSNGILPAVIDVQNRDEHNVFLGQCRAIVFGEDYARQGLKPALDFFNRLTKFPPNAKIVIARPTAADLLNIAWPEQELHDQNIRLFFSNRDNDKFGIKKWQLFQQIYDPLQDPIIPIATPSDGANTMKLTGMAVFNKDRMIGELDGYETLLMGLIAHPAKKNRIYIPVSGPTSIGFEVVSGKKQLKVFYKDNQPIFRYKFKFNAYLIELGSDTKPLNNRQVTDIEGISERFLKRRIIALLRKFQSLQSDPLGLGNYYRVQHQKRFNLKSWPEVYQQAKFQVNVDLFIERLGVLK